MNAAELTHAAVRLAEAGWSVFPCGDDKRPRTDRGHLDASADPGEARRMFSSARDASAIGLSTIGLLVADVDVRSDVDGCAWVAACVERLPPTRIHRSRSGGLHYLFTLPPNDGPRHWRRKFAEGVDIKAGGNGYIIVPPSPGYTVLTPIPPAPAPAWLLEHACHPPPANAVPPEPAQPRTWTGKTSSEAEDALSEAVRRIETAGSGSRYDTIYGQSWFIGRLVGGGALGRDDAERALVAAGQRVSSVNGGKPCRPAVITQQVRRGLDIGAASPLGTAALVMARRKREGTGGRAHA